MRRTGLIDVIFSFFLKVTWRSAVCVCDVTSLSKADFPFSYSIKCLEPTVVIGRYICSSFRPVWLRRVSGRLTWKESGVTACHTLKACRIALWVSFSPTLGVKLDMLRERKRRHSSNKQRVPTFTVRWAEVSECGCDDCVACKTCENTQHVQGSIG